MAFYGTVEGVKNNLPKLAKYIKPDAQATGTTDIKQTDVERVLTEYSRRADAQLSSRYAVPFSPVPEVMGSIVTDLASAKISLQFQTQIGQDENNNILAMRKDAKELLAMIAKGISDIPGVDEKTNKSELEQLLSEGREEIFNMEAESTWQEKLD